MNGEISSASTSPATPKAAGRARRGVLGSIATAATVASVATVGLLGFGTPAYAANLVTCGTRTDFAKAFSSAGNRCWANAGTVYVQDSRSVTRLCSGNNVVTWTYRWSLGTSTLNQARNTCANFSSINVTKLVIQ
jgi:hypothetical protein